MKLPTNATLYISMKIYKLTLKHCNTPVRFCEVQELDLLHLPPGGQRGGGGGLRGPGHGARVARSAGHGAGAALVLRPGAAAAGRLQHRDSEWRKTTMTIKVKLYIHGE